MRRLLYFLACVALGIGVVIMLSAGTGAGTPFGIAICVLMVLCGVLGGWVRGPIADGAQAPQLAGTGSAVALLSLFAGAMLLWRPALGTGLPMGSFLICLTVAGLLLIPVGLMGRRTDSPQ
jgi:hypothetical protein